MNNEVPKAGFLRKSAGWIFRIVSPDSPLGRESRIRKLRRQADQAARDKRIDVVEKRLREVLEAAESFGGEDIRYLQAVDEMAEFYESVGSYTQAESYYSDALKLRRRLYGEEAFEVARSINNLAILHYTQGKFHQAEPLYRRVVEMVESRKGKEHRETAVALQNYAALLRKLERTSEAEGLAARARQILKRK